MMIDLTTEEIHWLQYALIMAIANLPTDLPSDSETRQVLQGILEKLPTLGDAEAMEKN
jgi:hypothetical protein